MMSKSISIDEDALLEPNCPNVEESNLEPSISEQMSRESLKAAEWTETKILKENIQVKQHSFIRFSLIFFIEVLHRFTLSVFCVV